MSARTGATLRRAAPMSPGPSPSQSDHARALGALTIIAHDLRSPLANLTMLIEAMEAAALGEDLDRLQTSRERAHRLIEHLSGLMNSMLNRARTSGDPLRVEAAQLELGEIIDAAMELNRPTAERRAIEIRRGGRDSIAVFGDRSLLIQAVDNLLNNAIKHSEADTAIDCELIERGGGAVVRVSDRGCGLSELQIRRLFQPFTSWCQVDGRRGRSGLGLWIARLIAERHGSHVEASSRGMNLGAEFELHLPMTGKLARPRR